MHTVSYERYDVVVLFGAEGAPREPDSAESPDEEEL